MLSKRNLKLAIIIGSLLIVSTSFAQGRGMRGQGRGMGGSGYCAAGADCPRGGYYSGGGGYYGGGGGGYRGHSMRHGHGGYYVSPEERAAHREQMRNARSYEEAQQMRNDYRYKNQSRRWNNNSQR